MSPLSIHPRLPTLHQTTFIIQLKLIVAGVDFDLVINFLD